MSISPEIFRAYDIRGIYPNELDENGVYQIARAFGTLLHKKNNKLLANEKRKVLNVVVGRDDRRSSLSLSDAVIKGLRESGCNVIYVGVTVQPAMHYFTFMDNLDAGVNVTASHNPKQYNGIKLDFKNAEPCFGDELAKLYQSIQIGKYIDGDGWVVNKNLNQNYINFISSKFKLDKPLKVVIYCGNGATSILYPEVLSNIGAHVIPVKCYLDPDFPHGVPDPESGNFYPELEKDVIQSKADLGIGFDGDGDRIGDVDDKGRSHRSDKLAMIFAEDLLRKVPGSSVVYDVKCTQNLQTFVEQLGGKAKMLRTGRAYFLQQMYTNTAAMGIELSGHFYFKDDYLGYDDGIYATCRLLKIMEQTGQKLSQMMERLPTAYSTSEIKIDCSDDKKFETIEKIRDLVLNDKTGIYSNLNTLDGIRANVSKSGWFLIRASNTSPYISMRAEGKTKQEVNKILTIVYNLLRKYRYLKLKEIPASIILKQ